MFHGKILFFGGKNPIFRGKIQMFLGKIPSFDGKTSLLPPRPSWYPQRAIAGPDVQLGAQRVAGAADASAVGISAAENGGTFGFTMDVTSKIDGKTKC